MKKTVFTILLTFIFLSNSYISTCFAQENIVRLIYFFPSDSVPQPNIDTKMDTLIKNVQQVFTGQMEHYGFGSKAFQFETDGTGKAVVHRVKGKFKDEYYHNKAPTVWDEINEQFDLSNNIYITALDVSTELLDGFACGYGTPWGSGGAVLIPASGGCFDGDFGVDIAAHELGHAFGLIHDFRNNLIPWVNSYTNDPMVTSFCAAEWLDAHPYFNADDIYANEPTKVKMLPPSFVSAPSTVRISFEVTDPDGLHQAQLQARADIHGDIQLLECQSLSGESGVVEFVTTATDICLAIMDANGNYTLHQFSIDISDLISVPLKVVSILDTNLQREIRGTLGLASNEDITTHAMLKLTSLMAYNKQIKDITGLEHALNLTWIDLRESPITDLSPLAGLTQLKTLQLWNAPISDFSILTGLTQLQRLELGYTTISDLSPLTGPTELQHLDLRGNPLTDLSPLAGLTQLKTLQLWDAPISDFSILTGLTELQRLELGYTTISDLSPLTGLTELQHLDLRGNPLSYTAINTDIPALQAKGISVQFDNVAHPALLKFSGDGQTSEVGTTLAAPFVVEAMDRYGKPIQGVPVSFAITTGDGRLSSEITTTDATGKAQTTLTLGHTHSTYIVTATAIQITQSVVTFIAFAGEAPRRITEDVNDDGVVNIIPAEAVPTIAIKAAQRPPLYWVNAKTGRLHRLVGDMVENIVPNVENATSLAVDVENGTLYWAEKTSNKTGRIRLATLDGSNVRLVKNLTSVPLDIALDPASGKLYVINAWGKVQRLNVDGTNFQPNLIRGLESPKHLTLDVMGGKVYWTEQTSDKTGKVQRANLDGSTLELVKAFTSVPQGLAVDPKHGKLYLTNNRGRLQRMNVDGSKFQGKLITDLASPGEVAVDVAGGKVYWTEAGGVRRANLNGKNIKDVVLGLGSPSGLTLGIVSADAVAAAPLLSGTVADATLLLANYPNPFNPETWIPYQLAEPAEVMLSIYSIEGQLVRTMALGHQRAGKYQSRSRAAYWDGRNAFGEPVASGVYFYTLTAGDFTATRRMLILK